MIGGRAPARLSAAWVVAATVAVAAAAAAFFPSAFVSGDMVFALVWGEQLVAGELATFSPGPTPHPLAIAWGALVSPLGDDAAYRITQIVWGYLSAGAVVGLASGIAVRLFSPWSGALTASVLVTSGSLAALTFQTGYDLAFAALVLAALWIAVGDRRGVLPVLGLLAVAGLIRPEAWVVAGALWLWAARHATRRELVAGVALVASAPAVWMAMDALVMGDPLWSFHMTGSASEELYGRYSAVDNLVEGLRDLSRYVGPIGLALGSLALPWAVREGGRPAQALGALLGLLLTVFVVLTIAGMPSNARYLLVPACLIAILAGAAATLPASRGRLGGVAVVAAAGLLAVQAAGRADDPAAVRADVAPRAVWAAEARALVSRPEVGRVLRSCSSVAVPTLRLVPAFSYLSGRPPARWTSDRRGTGRPDAYVAPATPDVARAYLTRRRFGGDPTFSVPPGMQTVAENTAWRLYASRRAECVARALRSGSSTTRVHGFFHAAAQMGRTAYAPVHGLNERGVGPPIPRRFRRRDSHGTN